MAKRNCTVLSPIEYPTLQPWDYLHAAVKHGFTQKDAQILSGIPHATWMDWLYAKPQAKKRAPLLERLHRVATDMGWLAESQDVA